MGLDPDLGCRVWFWLIAGVLSALQGLRGLILQRDLVHSINARRAAAEVPPPLSALDKILAYQVPDFILNFFCTVAGFAALAIFARLLGSIPDPAKIDIGSGVFLSALLFVAVSGIAGILPWILSRTVYPGGKA